ncbi:hypothetical protein PilKf_01972 [Pillotina sp. SPG140]|jgi:hypothetical protein
MASPNKLTKTDTTESTRKLKIHHPLVFGGTIIVLIITIIAFVFLPAIVPDSGGSQIDLTFGVYDKVPIRYVPGNYFARVREFLEQRARSSRPDGYNAFIDYQVWQEAYNQTVVHTAILNEMKKAGYSVPSESVNLTMAALPQFQENGRFSTARYRQLTTAEQMDLWEEIKENLSEERYRADLEGLLISSKEAPFVAAMAQTVRTFEMVALPLSSYPDSEVSAYLSANPDLFRTVHLSRITITSSERDAQQILTSIQNATITFEDAARTQSKDSYAERSGDMGLRMIYELSGEIPDQQVRANLATLSAGSLSSIVPLNDTWVFFRAEEEPVDASPTDTTVLGRVRSYLMQEERGRVEDYVINYAETIRTEAQQSSFDTMLSQQGLDKKSFGPLPINYRSLDLFTPLESFSVSELAAAAQDEHFWQVAWSTPINTISEPLIVGDNVLVLHPTEEAEEEAELLNYIETAYSSYWLSYIMTESIREHFMNTGLLNDNFWRTYSTYFLPSS